MTFRLQAKNFFLTYPKCPITKQECSESLKKILEPETPFTYLLISQELHQSGDRHLHVLICLGKKLHVRNAKFFDISVGTKVYHSNTQSARHIEDVQKYLKKDDLEPLEEGTLPTRKRNWTDVLEANDKTTFLQLVKQTAPRDYVLNWDRLQTFAEANYALQPPPYQPCYTAFPNTPDNLQAWTTNLNLTDRSQTSQTTVTNTNGFVNTQVTSGK